MDSFLTYLLSSVTYALIFTELMVMLICVIAIIIIKLYTRWKSNRVEVNKERISAIINKELFLEDKVQDVVIPSEYCNFRNIVEELETFDQRFTDERWTEIKERIVDKYLLKRAERKSKSWYWLNRQLAARSFLLCPKKANEKVLKRLLNDPKYLVRIVAAVCIAKNNYKDLFFEMIEKMSKETKLSQFPYRDALVEVDQEKFQWIHALLESTNDPAIKEICLDILSTRITDDLFPLLQPYLKSENRECRLLAIKALGSIPKEESINTLIDHLADSDWELRSISIEGLHKLHATQAIHRLRDLLDDPIWWVRLQAALTLKDFGDDGIKVLQEQNPDKKPMAYEIAQYALALN